MIVSCLGLEHLHSLHACDSSFKLDTESSLFILQLSAYYLAEEHQLFKLFSGEKGSSISYSNYSLVRKVAQSLI